MKNGKKILGFMLVAVLVLVSAAFSDDSHFADWSNDDDYILLKTTENNYGQSIKVYTDGEYEYSVLKETGELLAVTLTAENMEMIISEYSESSPILSMDDARNKLNEEISNWFPEYDLASLVVNCNELTGNPIEEYIFIVEEIINNTRVNVASFAFAYDGTLSNFYGTHNTIEMFEGNLNLSEEDALAAAYAFILSAKEDIEQGMKPTEPLENGGVIHAEEGMILPDGVSVGDDFTPLIMPDYQITFSNIEDMKNVSVIKVMTQGRIAWSVDFSIQTTWGEINEIFNPEYTILIDAETGKVLNVFVTDGGD